MEEHVEHAALVHWLAREVQGCVPVADEIIMEKFMLRWQENDARLHLEITSALATRADDFNPHNVSPLQQLMAGHKGPQNMAVVDAMTHLDTHKTELEEKAFDLVLKQPCYDVEVRRTHTQK